MVDDRGEVNDLRIVVINVKGQGDSFQYKTRGLSYIEDGFYNRGGVEPEFNKMVKERLSSNCSSMSSC